MANGKRAHSWLTVTFGLAMIAMTLTLYSVFPIGLKIVLGMFVAFISIHYFTWGWSLGRIIQYEDCGNP